MLQERSGARDEYGGQLTAWRDVSPVRFSIEGTGGKEIETAGAVRAQSTFTLGMRYRPDIKATMRIVHDGRFLNITNVSDLEERHKELSVTVIEGESPN
jgi:SPP1 family predicted phage head-tail adaptor